MGEDRAGCGSMRDGGLHVLGRTAAAGGGRRHAAADIFRPLFGRVPAAGDRKPGHGCRSLDLRRYRCATGAGRSPYLRRNIARVPRDRLEDSVLIRRVAITGPAWYGRGHESSALATRIRPPAEPGTAGAAPLDRLA